MERTETSHQVGLMQASEIAVYLLSSCGSLASFDSYMFGSTLHGIGQDIDILIVGPTGEELSRLKTEISAAGTLLPLHVLYMQPAEARQTDFVAKEKCIPLTELALSAPR